MPVNTPEVKKYDIIISGAGPAGSACALALHGAGLKVCIIEKETFPRDKVCGDAVPGRAIKTLKSISPAYGEAFSRFSNKSLSKHTQLHFKGETLQVSWILEAYTAPRFDFDDFVFSLVREHTDTDIYTGVTTAGVAINEQGVVLTDKAGKYRFEGQLLIGADGALSPIAKQLAGRTLDRQHHVGSVRAYYNGITGIDKNITEIFFDKKYLPSYLWVFPIADGRANVGFGMLSKEIARKKMDIKKAFYDFIADSPVLSERFKNAEQVSPLQGFGLPLGSRRVTISGNRFMLCGDAASLIDPISGDGIGNAMLSGKLAADRAKMCFDNNDFSALFMSGYDKELWGRIGKELKMRYKIQQTLGKMPVLLDVLFKAGKNERIKRMMHRYI